MIVHRFMSETEYEGLIAGGKMMNGTIHKDDGKKTTSVGFCFFVEDPEVAIHWLGGCCDPEWCVTMEFPDGYLTESVSTYRDAERDDLYIPVGKGHKTIKRKEYCCTCYDNKVAKIITSTQRYYQYAEIRRLLKRVGLI